MVRESPSIRPEGSALDQNKKKEKEKQRSEAEQAAKSWNEMLKEFYNYPLSPAEQRAAIEEMGKVDFDYQDKAERKRVMEQAIRKAAGTLPEKLHHPEEGQEEKISNKAELAAWINKRALYWGEERQLSKEDIQILVQSLMTPKFEQMNDEERTEEMLARIENMREMQRRIAAK